MQFLLAGAVEILSRVGAKLLFAPRHGPVCPLDPHIAPTNGAVRLKVSVIHR